MQLRRNILLAVMIILFIYFKIHSCSQDAIVVPQPPPVDTPASMLLNATDVYFCDADHGWVAGHQGTLILTADGGKTWKAAAAGDLDIRSIFFHDTDRGWAVGNKGKLYRSLDGGNTWEQVLFTGTPQTDNLQDVLFLSEKHGFILGYSGLFVTTDGGTGWENNWLPVVDYRGAWSMSVVGEKTCFLLGSRWSDADPELLYRSDDGGTVWKSVPGSNASVLRGILTIHFVEGATGWAGGGAVMKTSDGGGTWQTQIETATVRRFFFFDDREGFAVGRTAILHTTDGGDSWTDVAPRDESIVDLCSVHFIDRGRGWVVGRGTEEVIGDGIFRFSVVLSTADGGTTWTVRRFAWKVSDFASSAGDD